MDIFNSVAEAERECMINLTNLSRQIKINSYCGKNINTNELLYWMYYSDYSKLNEQEKDKLISNYYTGNKIKIK